MVLTLLIITGVSATAVGLIYNVTVGPIQEAKSAKTTNAISLVLPTFDNDPGQTRQVQEIDGKEIVIYTALSGSDTVGYAIETFSTAGFGGMIKLMVGFTKEGSIYRVETLSHNETPGLGDKMEGKKSDFSVQFEGKDPASFNLMVKKDGGDVDAITASTISSRAFSDAVARAYKVYQSINGEVSHE